MSASFDNHSHRTQHSVFKWTVLVCCVVVLAMAMMSEAYAARQSIVGSSIETGNSRSGAFSRNRVNENSVLVSSTCCSSEHVAVEATNTAELSSSAAADASTGSNKIGEKKKNPSRVTLRELGLLQLAAHDFFNVDRSIEVDSENGDLDLSTLLDHGYENIAIGGEVRNRENIILFTVAKEYGEYYLSNRARQGAEKAREKTLKKYHRELGKMFEKLFGEDMPRPASGTATMTENLAFRTIHDLLPGKITFDGALIDTLDHSLAGKTLSKKELEALSSPLDGTLDPEFLDIMILFPPSTIIHINLLERDSSFASQFGTDHTFEHFLGELEDGSYDSNEDVMHNIRNLFAKGLYFN